MEYADLSVVCDAWCHTSRTDKKKKKKRGGGGGGGVTIMNLFKAKTPQCVQLTLQLKYKE